MKKGKFGPLGPNSLAISDNVAKANGLSPRKPVYANGDYLGNYDDRAPERNTIDVYDPDNRAGRLPFFPRSQTESGNERRFQSIFAATTREGELELNILPSWPPNGASFGTNNPGFPIGLARQSQRARRFEVCL